MKPPRDAENDTRCGGCPVTQRCAPSPGKRRRGSASPSPSSGTDPREPQARPPAQGTGGPAGKGARAAETVVNGGHVLSVVFARRCADGAPPTCRLHGSGGMRPRGPARGEGHVSRPTAATREAEALGGVTALQRPGPSPLTG